MYKLDQEEQDILSFFEQRKLKRSKSVSRDKTIAKGLAILHMKNCV